MVFITKLGPQVSLSSVPFFGVNREERGRGERRERERNRDFNDLLIHFSS
jgi:hypothetical protein